MDEIEIREAPDHIWEHMPGESSKAYARFCEYRDMGPQRSLAKLRRAHGEEEGWSRASIEDLSERWRWKARASAWDDEQDRIRREAQAKESLEMAERQARDGADMQRLARGAMAKWVRQDPATGQMVLAENLSPSEVARLYRLGFEVERLARGEPTIVTEEKMGADFEYSEERIAAGIAFALAQASVESGGMGGGGQENSLPASTPADADSVDGIPALDTRQAEPACASSAEPDTGET